MAEAVRAVGPCGGGYVCVLAVSVLGTTGVSFGPCRAICGAAVHPRSCPPALSGAPWTRQHRHHWGHLTSPLRRQQGRVESPCVHIDLCVLAHGYECGSGTRNRPHDEHASCPRNAGDAAMLQCQTGCRRCQRSAFNVLRSCRPAPDAAADSWGAGPARLVLVLTRPRRAPRSRYHRICAASRAWAPTIAYARRGGPRCQPWSRSR